MATIELVNCHVAVKNSSDVPFDLKYDGKVYHYPSKRVTIVPFEIAHHHFGFELDQKGNLFRNTQDEYEDGEETAFYSARANLLPWQWMSNALAKVKIEDEDGNETDLTHGQKFRQLKNAYENGITGKIVRAPKVISDEQFDKL